ncbi:MAG TPA: hypothetical protein VIA18_16335 [Polyangia bacterium]|jgi:alkylhydroperoxidase family enzyme|nr:hypothetical protein [Polyangia bacterium]
MADIDAARRGLIARILDGDGDATKAQRRAAFDDAGERSSTRSLVDKVARHAARVGDDDFAAARAAGLTEDQLFELVICAAVGEANRQYEAALAALDAAEKSA